MNIAAANLGVGRARDSFFVYDREHDAAGWHMHCGPYSTFAQAAEWIHGVSEVKSDAH